MDEIEQEVMRMYPKTLRERNCWSHRDRMQNLRRIYREKLTNDRSAKTTIQPEELPPDETV